MAANNGINVINKIKMEKKQSSIDWFIQQFNGKTSRIANMIGVEKYNSIIKQAKSMHKQEIKEAWLDGEWWDSEKDGEQYYKETFGGQDNE